MSRLSVTTTAVCRHPPGGTGRTRGTPQLSGDQDGPGQARDGT